MKILTFTYTKADGSVSNRVLAVAVSPTHLYAGTDLSSLTQEEQVMFANRFNELHEQYVSAVTELKEEFDLYYTYRKFSPDKMTKVIEEEI